MTANNNDAPSARGAKLPELLQWRATTLSRRLHARDISCHELMSATLEHIDAVNPRVNAIVSRREPESLLQEANTADAELAAGRSRGWLHGIPQAIKDLSDAAGLPTRQGSPLTAGHVAGEDSLMTARMRAAGALIVGKTNTPEFGLGSQSYNPVFGATRCAFDTSRTAGGSSGGAGAALATRMLTVADGSDMMGSLRNPAAFNHVIGMRPSFGRVPGVAAEPFGQQLSTNGPMGRCVEDVARLLVTQSGHDRRAPLSLAEPLLPVDVDVAQALPRELKGTRIGWLGDWDGYLAMEPGILELGRSALERFTTLGCDIEPAALPYSAHALWQSWTTLRHWSVSGLLGAYYADPASRERLKPEACWEVERGLELCAQDIYAANVQRGEAYRAWLALFERFDYLAMPTAQVFPFDAETHWPTSIAGRPMDSYHRWMEVVIPASMLGAPAISLPAGVNALGLPTGFQLIGRPRDDWGVLQLAHAFEQASGDLAPLPPLLT
ncbi:amidase [Salinicola rhizosphaerae]|uniref:Amidase n=1 Tax=Salinicola rhizosphaerae TaxID=1443141 RepID=A0ABQ3DVV7_9GAMM|nr:amidase [Salinicola rhizosphaerae]GHB15206.1 amidase [Salinicola rhizosphaerae]